MSVPENGSKGSNIPVRLLGVLSDCGFGVGNGSWAFLDRITTFSAMCGLEAASYIKHQLSKIISEFVINKINTVGSLAAY